MNRRNFLRNGSLATFSLAGLSEQAALNKPIVDDAGFDITEITIEALQDKMRSGSTTATEITRIYLDRIRKIDAAGPKLNAVIEINPDALSSAAELDAERKKGTIRGPLHGIPVLVKDNINTGDKMQTTAGALALEGNIAASDAFIIKQLRKAGAIILGKTNLSEWANFRSSRSCSGWSSRGLQTRNPYLLTHNPCGSSSGSGVAAAANLCVVAIGTETDGSVTCPASVNGIVGLKPTVGLISRTGIIPISSTQDTAGPMARTVKDLAIVLGAMTGIDDLDPVTRESSGKVQADYTRFLNKNALQGKRIGVERKFQGDNLQLQALWNSTRQVLVKLGAEIIEIDYLDKYNDIGSSEFLLMKYEFKDGVNKYLANANARVKSLRDVIAFNLANASRTMPYFNQDTLVDCEKMGGLDSPEYLEAIKKSAMGSRSIIQSVMAEHKLDAISGLTMGPACSIDRWYGDRWGDVSLTTPAATSGFPHISVPCGEVYALPVGLSFFSLPYTEAQLISYAYAFEQATKIRRKPAFLTGFE